MSGRSLAAAAALACAAAVLAAQAGLPAPAFQVDPYWPKPLPNSWILGSVTGVRVDAKDHVWLVHRGADSLTARTENGLGTNPPTAEICCRPAPFVLEFDAAGTLVSHWGGPGDGYEWPRSPGGLAIDREGNVWIAAAGVTEAAGGGRGRAGSPSTGSGQAAQPAPRPQDAHVLKFSRAGKFLLQIGQAGKSDAADPKTLARPLGLEVDGTEVFVADAGHQRVAVFDATSGAYKRHWGANGSTPFKTVSCVRIGIDGLVYVCDRQNNRIQVFRKDGTFVKEATVSKTTLGDGAVWDLAFSRDKGQRYVYVADGQDQKVFVLRRDTLATIGSFGSGGRYPGQFFGVGAIAVDSKETVYTGETYEGKRLQRFVFKGPESGSGAKR
jgi:DNA-binding beta-propeller fold protein YncE